MSADNGLIWGDGFVYARPIDPREGNDWEQVGFIVSPDLPSPSQEAEAILSDEDDQCPSASA